MSFRLGYYGDQRQEVLDGLAAVCQFLGAQRIFVTAETIGSVDVLLWNYVRPLDESMAVRLRTHPNVFLLPERGGMPSGHTSWFRPEVLDEAYCVVPFDPDELALRIVMASARRKQNLAYAFDPRFYLQHQPFFDKYLLV